MRLNENKDYKVYDRYRSVYSAQNAEQGLNPILSSFEEISQKSLR